MAYRVEEKETKECFTIVCTNSVEYVWAYTLEEAEQIVLDKGLGILI